MTWCVPPNSKKIFVSDPNERLATTVHTVKVYIIAFPHPEILDLFKSTANHNVYRRVLITWFQLPNLIQDRYCGSIYTQMLRNPLYADMLDDADWYFVPMINVDGYVETWNGVSAVTVSAAD